MDPSLFIELTFQSVAFLLIVGFIGGLVSGFIGSGGAFVLTPGMMSLGVPGVVAVASNSEHGLEQLGLGVTRRQADGTPDSRRFADGIEAQGLVVDEHGVLVRGDELPEMPRPQECRHEEPLLQRSCTVDESPVFRRKRCVVSKDRPLDPRPLEHAPAANAVDHAEGMAVESDDVIGGDRGGRPSDILDPRLFGHEVIAVLGRKGATGHLGEVRGGQRREEPPGRVAVGIAEKPGNRHVGHGRADLVVMDEAAAVEDGLHVDPGAGMGLRGERLEEVAGVGVAGDEGAEPGGAAARVPDEVREPTPWGGALRRHHRVHRGRQGESSG